MVVVSKIMLVTGVFSSATHLVAAELDSPRNRVGLSVDICDQDCCELLWSFAENGGQPGWFSNWTGDPDGNNIHGYANHTCPCPELHVPMAWGPEKKTKTNCDPVCHNILPGENYPVNITAANQTRTTVNNVAVDTIHNSADISKLVEENKLNFSDFGMKLNFMPKSCFFDKKNRQNYFFFSARNSKILF